MKNLQLFAVALSLFSLSLFAQESTQFLEVDYVMEVKLDAEKVLETIPASIKHQVEGPIRQEIKQGIFVDYKLQTNSTESIFQLRQKLDNSQGQLGIIYSQIAEGDKEPLYKNINEGYYMKSFNIGKVFLVKDTLSGLDWKISKEKEIIAGYETYKAIGKLQDTIQISAWYAPKLNIKDGPAKFWGLPGLILKAEFEIAGMHHIITAKNIQVKDNLEIKKPAIGKTVTEKEFEAEVKAIQEKYQEIMSGEVDKD